MAKTKENICSLDMEKDNDNSISAGIFFFQLLYKI